MGFGIAYVVLDRRAVVTQVGCGAPYPVDVNVGCDDMPAAGEETTGDLPSHSASGTRDNGDVRGVSGLHHCGLLASMTQDQRNVRLAAAMLAAAQAPRAIQSCA